MSSLKKRKNRLSTYLGVVKTVGKAWTNRLRIQKKKSATAFPLKFLKAGCQNIHLDQILRADFVKRFKQATLLIEISSFQS